MSINRFENPIVLFDGVCNLCNGSVNFLIKRDKEKILRYAAFQSDAAQKLLRKFDLDPLKPESVILIEGDRIYSKSKAVLELIKFLPRYWRLLEFIKIIPTNLSDSVYDFIARNRYKWFGKKNRCMIPQPGIRRFFLD